jgi:hypothetical protein
MNRGLNPIHRCETRLHEAPNAWQARVKCLTIGVVFFSAALNMAASKALGQGTEGTLEQRQACTPDAMTLCNNFIPDAVRVKECLIHHIALLSTSCRQVIENSGRSSAAATSGSPHKTK